MLINVGDQLAVGVVNGYTNDGATMVVWHPDPNLTDQHWTLGWSTVGSTGGITIGSNLTSASSVMDLNTATNEVALWHSLTGTNQLWNFTDAPVKNQFSIKNIQTGGCLTDNGLGAQLSVSSCVAGDASQIWQLT